jgi:predicted permease
MVSGDFFRVLGVAAMQGRVFTTEDDRRGGGSSGAVAVISYRFWKRNFEEGSTAIGKTIRLNRRTFEVVGVTPPWFTGLNADRSYDIAIPLSSEPLFHPDRSDLDCRLCWWLQVMGRLAPEETVEQAGEHMRVFAPEVFRATLPQELPSKAQTEYQKHSLLLRPASTGFSATGNQYRTALFTLMAITALVLLTACANIANLLLARASARQRELSVRMAMGAGRSRVVRQLMTESLLLSILGAAGGFLFAVWGSSLLVRLLSKTGNPLEIDLSPDLHLLGFTVATAVLTAILFGLAPALRATRVELNQVLKESARNTVSGSTRFNLGKALVTGQVALSLILLVGAGLFLGTLRNLLTVDPGFNRENVLLVTANVQQTSIPKTQRLRVYREVLERLQGLPGVLSAASSMITPISGIGWAQYAYPEGFIAKSPRESIVFLNRVSPGYFQTMKTPLTLGRDFNGHDDLHSPLVMIISESAARRFFGAANSIGKTIGLDKIGKKDEKDIFQVIGVVKDTKYAKINEEPRRSGYVVSTQDPDPGSQIRYEVRSDQTVEALIPSVRSAITGINRDVALEFRNLETQVNESLMQPRMVALLSTAFGALALLLPMVGLYGITIYAAVRRRGEIGIRMALGAQRGSVIWLMFQDMLLLLVAGMSLGIAASLAMGRLIESLLYGVRPNDPARLIGAAVILAVAAAIAAYLPARRAARLDPMAALREE